MLLRSANSEHPAGLGNSSGLVGRNYMQHIFSAIIGVASFETPHSREDLL